MDRRDPDNLTRGQFLLRTGHLTLAALVGTDTARADPGKNSQGYAVSVNPKDGARMILIPAGTFTMGNADFPDAKPHSVPLSAYYLYENLVTVAMYEAYCQATGNIMPISPKFDPGWSKKDHPMLNMSWAEARAYCVWAGGDLPTEAQWEKGAGWDEKAGKARKFPWGDSFDGSKLWCPQNKSWDADGTTRAGRFPSGASPYGLLDMAGNVWQWCRDWYDDGFYSSSLSEKLDPWNESVGAKQERIVRGGSWDVGLEVAFRATTRHASFPAKEGEGYYWGFRVSLPGRRQSAPRDSRAPAGRKYHPAGQESGSGEFAVA